MTGGDIETSADTTLREREVPQTLWHYTSREGLLGILKEKAGWATHISYLNDAKEFRHAAELMQGLLSAREPADDHERLALEAMRRIELTELSPSIQGGFVFSLSAKGDDLSQWRGYCKGRDAYALGFSGANLRDTLGRSGFALVPCEYDPAVQRKLLSEVIDTCFKTMHRLGAGGGPLQPHVNPDLAFPLLFLSLLEVASVIKHPKFEGEQEWRLVSSSVYPDPLKVIFRAKRSLLVPYRTVALKSLGPYLGITDIVVGPTPHMRLEVGALEQLFLTYALPAAGQPTTQLRIRRSEVPYRDW